MRLALTTALLVSAAMLGGCFEPAHEQYLRRSDFVSLGAGNAVAHNQAVQTINPWPYWAGNDRINMDGRRGEIAITRYREDDVKPPQTTKLEPFQPVRQSSGGSADVGGTP